MDSQGIVAQIYFPPCIWSAWGVPLPRCFVSREEEWATGLDHELTHACCLHALRWSVFGAVPRTVSELGAPGMGTELTEMVVTALAPFLCCGRSGRST